MYVSMYVPMFECILPWRCVLCSGIVSWHRAESGAKWVIGNIESGQPVYLYNLGMKGGRF
jgi:hypothetical protein